MSRAAGNVAEVFDEEAVIREALDNFAALIGDMDYNDAINLMGLGRFQFLRRKRMRLELMALYMALWRLALARSFPPHADAMFATFLAEYEGSHTGKACEGVTARAREYWAMIHPVGDSDFSDVARHLTSFLISDQRDVRALTLKLALHIRSAYRFIFERLI